MATLALHVDGVERRFGALRAIDGVNLQIEPGERRVLLGTNGAGKTTLFNIIAGDFPPSAGRIFLHGQDVTALPAHARARLGIARTYQTSSLFKGLSIEENLAIAYHGSRPGRFSVLRPGRNDAGARQRRHVLGVVGLEHRLHRPVAELSHGEQRQLELGMALMQSPRVLLLDEPAAGLSPAERPLLLALIRNLPREITLLMIEHDMDVALQIADEVTVMKDGAVVASGKPSEIRVNPLVRAIYLGEAE
jgi:branched-chain amino acid transport system ATP-binding protein